MSALLVPLGSWAPVTIRQAPSVHHLDEDQVQWADPPKSMVAAARTCISAQRGVLYDTSVDELTVPELAP